MSVIGMDLGGTKLAAAVFDVSGTIQEKVMLPLAGRRGDKVGELIVQQALHLLQWAEKQQQKITALGISVPGIYYAKTGRVWAPNIPEWDDYPLLKKLELALNDRQLAIRIDSDRACYILGETWQGAARGCKNAIFLAIGTGIGAGILVDDEVLRGHNDIAGAVGWMGHQQPYRPEYATYGCFEYHASGEGLAKVARVYLAQEKGYQGSLGAQVTSAEIFAAYEQGDAIAQRVLDEAIVHWGMAVANLVSIFNPEMIVFGGGVFGPAARFLDRIRAEAQKWAQPISFKQVQLAVSTLGGDAGLIGAGRLALQQEELQVSKLQVSG